MKHTIFLITTLAAWASASKQYCNTGTDGDGSCEKQGWNTFCCMNNPNEPDFQITRTVLDTSNAPNGFDNCGPGNNGKVSCCDPKEK
ncbi:hypothetical protein HYALB_00011741 [Hymenoscyphus albidus]|uniref:Hydrophobin n=1 Tax=Hymenoscyphus albidus TaxID=595503 RepID=A0A9N9LW43_9HELO|nr:hypothetical protein HYALB_00011741 [Hymenoscyphus albidus]